MENHFYAHTALSTKPYKNSLLVYIHGKATVTVIIAGPSKATSNEVEYWIFMVFKVHNQSVNHEQRWENQL